ncbi:MAG: tetratricopeptide repeat protein [Sphingomicrobium sp.]
MAALSRTTGTLAGAPADRGSDYETFLIANGLIKVRGRRNVLLAEELLRPIVQRHPDWPEAKLALAKTLYLTQGQAVEAFRLAQAVAIADPTSGLAFALMGVTSPDRRRTLGWLETAVRQEPFDAEILMFLGGAQQEQMQFERAFQTVLKVWQLEPYWVRANQVSDLAAELGYSAMANEIDRTLAASHPQRHQRLLARARLEMRTGEWGAALQSAKQALIDPDNPETNEAMLKVLKLSAAMGQATGIEPRNPAAAIFQSLYRGVLPDRSTLERDGVPPKDFWRLNEVLLIAPALFVATGREAELVRLFDRSFANPREMLEHMQVHIPWGPSKFGSVAPYLALSLRELGRHEEGQRHLESARALLQDAKAKGRTPTGHLVDLARIEATLGNRRAALDLLRQARSQGWPRIGHGPLPMILTTLRDDPALRSLAGAPEFEAAERRLAELKRG